MCDSLSGGNATLPIKLPVRLLACQRILLTLFLVNCALRLGFLLEGIARFGRSIDRPKEGVELPKTEGDCKLLVCVFDTLS